MAKNTTKKGTHKAHLITDTSPQVGRYVGKNTHHGVGFIHRTTGDGKGVVIDKSVVTGGELLEAAKVPEAKIYDGRIAAGVHESMAELYELGLIDQDAMAEFDESCLVPVEKVEAPNIKALREREKVSQVVLAGYLGVAVNTVSQWERGVRRPDGPVIKLLSLVERHGLDYIR